MIVCMILLGPLARLWVTGCGVNMGPLAMVMPENGSVFAPTVGLDGVVWRLGLNWYGSKSKSEAMWPSDGVGDH